MDVLLTVEDRRILEASLRRDVAGVPALRARIVLLAAEGLGNAAIASELRIAAGTAGAWRRRFVEGGLTALRDERRPGRPRRIGDELIGAVVLATMEATRAEVRSSTRSMGERLGMSQSSVSRIWRAYGLQPGAPLLGRGSGATAEWVGLYVSPEERAAAFVKPRPGSPSSKRVERDPAAAYLLQALETAGARAAQEGRDGAYSLSEFLGGLDREVSPTEARIDILFHGGQRVTTSSLHAVLQQPRRFRWHFCGGYASWIEGLERLASAKSGGKKAGLPRLGEAMARIEGRRFHWIRESG